MNQAKPKFEQTQMFENTHSFDPSGDVDIMSRYCVDATGLMRNRNAIYRGSYRVAGVLGAAAQIVGCTSKLWTMVTCNPQRVAFEDEEAGRKVTDWKQLLRNVLVDLHNFSLITLLMLDEGNFDGRVTVEEHYNSKGE